METVFDSVIPELAPKEPRKSPTLAELKKFNKGFVTRMLPTVTVCGHKIDPELGPNSNCTDCWFAYFNSDAARVEKWCEQVVKNDGQELREFYGDKYVKWFKRFIKAVNQLKENSGKE